MQSSYNLIKSNSTLSSDKKVITTSYEVNQYDTEEILNNEDLYIQRKNIIENYESIGAGIIKDAQNKKEEILMESRTKAALMEKNAYEKGYSQGIQNGHEDGKKEAIESTLPKVQEDAKNIIENAQRILLNAQNDYNNYLMEKKQEIIELSLTIAKKILNKEVNVDDGINEIIESAFESAKGEENVIIKCNGMYEESIRNKIKFWKTSYSISGEIFVMIDNTIEPGNAIVEKNNGIVKIGIETGLEAIIKAILG